MNTPANSTTREMRKNNIALVIRTLKALGAATKGEVAANTGLSAATCGAVLNELATSGEVLTLEREASRGGRPAQRYACNPDFFSVLSLYAAGSDEAAELVWSVTSATGEPLDSGDMPFIPLTAERFYQQIASLLAVFPVVQAIGIGLPGVIVDGVVTSCDISLFTGMAVTAEIASRSGRFTEMGNDINFTAWGFYRSNCPGVKAPVAYIFKPDVPCTGCGMVINGQVLTGANNFAGEVSHLPFTPGITLSLTEELAHIVVSLAALINPVMVALSGTRLNQSQLPEIVQICQKHIPEKHLPALIYRPSIRQDYLQGIAELTLENYNHHRLFGE
ncbi:ROK family transcriptional regulator [Erwinia persicina]|uniref:ROK family transcriptional regulator n=1 Tax=Erwinia persicina TaxID=55211 RepID=UPI001784DF65|nr:ROK family protein [Erwinia persicina]MBD8216582.1 ROK family protein [Erwinia persicina]